MADTQRTLSALLAILADNTAGDISPQDLRDAVVTVFANYADIRTTSSGTFSASNITWTKFQFASDGLSAGCVTANAASDRIGVTVTGVYRATLLLDVTSGAGTLSFRFEVNAGGTAAGSAGTPSGVNGRLHMETLLSLTAGDYVEAFVFGTTTSSLHTVNNACLRLERIG